MPTKTERILSYLPGTFRPSPQQSALRALVDAFGAELLNAENSLAAIMQAHWVDHADRGADEIDDLARIAALYGLAPRCETAADGDDQLCRLPPICDETVEEFREHLKRYVRTFLEGTVTVQGLLRVTAETLGLRIADEYDEMDTWWERGTDELVTVHPRGDDAAQRVLGQPSVTVHGQAAQPAQVVGSTNLGGGVDLRATPMLRLQIDNGSPLDVDLSGDGSDPAPIGLSGIVAVINTAVGFEVARAEGDFLVLQTTSVGAERKLYVHEILHDAAPLVLGLAARTYRGHAARAAQVQGRANLSAGVDLRSERYLRLVIDGATTAEVDCAGPDAANTTLAQITAAINSAIGDAIASHDDQYLTLTSPTSGFDSTIALQQPAAQNATTRLLGTVATFHQGEGEQPARLTGTRDLSRGVDLSEHFTIQLSVDGASFVTINCAGQEPSNTSLPEIVAAINAAFAPDVARHDGQFVIVTSPTLGAASSVVVETAPDADAVEAIFGIRPRVFAGAAATGARIVGAVDLRAGANLFARYRLALAVDGGPPVAVDLRTASSDWHAVMLPDLAAAVNQALGAQIAADNGQNLILASPTVGSASRLLVSPLTEIRRRRFVTRVPILDDAATAIFGFVAKEASGTPATNARLVGQKDLSRGVDLSAKSYLRVAIDNQPAADIDCRGGRPRATLITEVVAQINAARGAEVASHNGANLTLISTKSGTSSKIVLEPPRAEDALEPLLAVAPGLVRGQEATKVSFVSTVDLSAGIELEANAALKLTLDDDDAVEITLTDAEAASKTLTQLVLAINQQLAINAVSHDGTRLSISSAKNGAESRIEFGTPSGLDVTAALFGISTPRSYQGADATPARIVGQPDLSTNVDLQVARFLRLSIDGGEIIEIDCAAPAADAAHVTLTEIIEAINAVTASETASDIASAEDGHLVLTAPTAGFSSRIAIEHYTSGDARDLLFGTGVSAVLGEDAVPAAITGDVDLLTPANLADRSVLRIAVDGGRPVDIDVAGVDPANTTLVEIVSAINAEFPSMAAATADDHLKIVAPTNDETSKLCLQPVRQLELIEYPPVAEEPRTAQVRHGDSWTVVNRGAAATVAEIAISNKNGVAGPALVNTATGWHIHLFTALSNAETLRLARDPHLGIRAVIQTAHGGVRHVPPSQILVGPLGIQVSVPFEQAYALSVNEDGPATLQLNNPRAKTIVRLRAKNGLHAVSALVVESIAYSSEIETDAQRTRINGRVQGSEAGYFLIDNAGEQIAHLRAGPGVALAHYQNVAVAASGSRHAGEPPLLVVTAIARLFDVTIVSTPKEDGCVDDEQDGGDNNHNDTSSDSTNADVEHYKAVTIGTDPRSANALVWQINNASPPSQLIFAEALPKEQILNLPRGRTEWLFHDCYGDRFNQAVLNHSRFAGGLCLDRAIFNVSRFGTSANGDVGSVFATAVAEDEPVTEVVFNWSSHLPGALQVNLPLDLPERFGGRFNQVRFGQPADAPEIIKNVVTEPPEDDDYIVKRIAAESGLVSACLADDVPLGWEAIQVSFRQPHFLTLGSAEEHAQLYLAEDGFDGFIKIKALEAGTWANRIAVSVRPSGPTSPAIYDICIIYQGAPFENARQAVRGDPSPPLAQELLKPSPVGILRAKAAGVIADVTRDSTASYDT